jgi:hypothetical protein
LHAPCKILGLTPFPVNTSAASKASTFSAKAVLMS